MIQNTRRHTLWMLLAGCVILLALSLRLYRLETVPLDYDRSYPHGIGIDLLDSLRDGTFGDVALHGQPQSLGWPNTLATNYILAGIALVDRSPMFALLLVAMSNVLTTALCIAITQLLFGWRAAIFAGVVAATSPWEIFLTRGTWLPGLFELGLALPACLFWLGVIRHRRKYMVSGLLIGALSMHIYTVGLGMALQFGIGFPFVALRRRRGWSLAVAAIVVLVISLAGYMVVLRKADPQLLVSPRIRLNYSPASVQSGLDRGWPINTLALERSISLITGSGFPEAGVGDYAHLDASGAALLNIRVVVVAIAFLVGMIALVFRRPRSLPAMLILLWYWIPVVFITALTTVSRATPVNYYYIVLVSPAVCIIAGYGMDRVLRIAPPSNTIKVVLSAALITVMAVPSFIAQHQLADLQWSGVGAISVTDLALGELRPLRQAWESACAELTVPYNPFEDRQELQYWAYSWTGNKARVAAQTEVNLGTAQTWAGSERRCAIRLTSQAAPPDVQVIATSAHAALYQPASHASTAPDAEVMTSIGWRLEPPVIPPQVKPGQPMLLIFRWRIVTVPDEPHAAWRYDLFVKLLDANGKAITQSDAATIPGSAWRPLIEVAQSLVLDVPATAHGAGRIEISLYDRAQGRNALFKPGVADTVTLSFPVTLGQ